ncbi:hypothetical protein CCO03_08495 [Comamonas serinivorans]|uniref:Uncharacterized protein n=1 Tax=Comamonas serinivorans TaxID=1082851 RepID=A0A1Y0EM82_9BURK|nr:hypothetical protein [Comamonas serinivorans]ARU04707.1 hypothetical protein CCO03_08495 [Comamonas serinivorans]
MIISAQKLHTLEQAVNAAPVNRAQRRAAKRNRNVRLTKRDVAQAIKKQVAPLVLLDDCRPYEQADLTPDLLRIRSGFERLQTGQADDEDFNRVAVAINLARIRAEEIDPALVEILEAGQQAMKRCRARSVSHGRFGFDGQGMSQTAEALDAHDAIVTASTPKQMQTALDVLRKIYMRMHPGHAIGLTSHPARH